MLVLLITGTELKTEGLVGSVSSIAIAIESYEFFDVCAMTYGLVRHRANNAQNGIA